jgi:hypothetical protein
MWKSGELNIPVLEKKVFFEEMKGNMACSETFKTF